MTNRAKSYTLGKDAYLVVNGSEYKNVKDVTLSLSRDEISVETRASNGWKLSAGGNRSAKLEFDSVYNPTGDPSYIDLWNAFLTGDQVEVTALTGEGGIGLSGYWEVLEASREEALDGAITTSFSLVLAERPNS